MLQRAVHFGFPERSMGEDITHFGDPAGAISDWVDSVAHRFPIMRSDLDSVGFGDATIGGLPIEVMDMSFTARPGSVLAITPYPADGQSNVPPVFLGNELPDPLKSPGIPPSAGYPTGYPITLTFSPGARVKVTGYEVLDPSGAVLSVYVPNIPSPDDDNALAILPKAPLKASTVYGVRVAGTINGQPFEKDWSFT